MRTTCPSCPQKVKKLIVGKKPIHAWPSGMGPPAHHSGLWQAELAGDSQAFKAVPAGLRNPGCLLGLHLRPSGP